MNLKKMTTILILSVFVLGTFTTGAFAKNNNPQVDIKVLDTGSVQIIQNFKDVGEAKWALKHVMKMRLENIIMGYQDGTFKPNKPVTRAEAVVLTIRAAGLQDEVEQTVINSVYLPFKDAKSIPVWAKQAIAVAVERGYVAAASTDEFQANKPATREWVVMLVAKALDLKPMEITLPFKDAGSISPEITGYVAAVVYDQLISGYPDGNFKPNKPVTRAEIAVMLGLSTDELQIPGKQKNKLEGTVVSTAVYASTYAQGSITLDIKGRDNTTLTLPVAKGAVIYSMDKTAAFADIRTGAQVAIVIDEKGSAVYIEVIPETLKGVVEAVYSDKIDILEFDKDKRHGPDTTIKSYNFATNVVTVLNGATAKVTDLKAGDKITLTIDAAGKVVNIKASRFVAKDDEDENDRNKDKSKSEKEVKLEIEGTVASVTGSTVTVTGEDGKTATYTVASGAEIKIDGEQGILTQLKANDAVELKISNNLVIKLTVENEDDEDEDDEDED